MIINADARAYLRAHPPETVDLIVSDIPYKVISGGNTTKYQRCAGILSANDGKIFDHNDTHHSEYMDDLYRVLKPVAHCYLFTNLLNLWDLRDEMVRVGFEIHNLLPWIKDNVTPNRWFMKDTEYVIFARKGPARTIYTPGARSSSTLPAPRPPPT